MANISELRIGQGNVNVEGVMTEIGDTRVFNKFGRELKVANAILRDDSGSVKLTLWNDDVTRFKDGDKVKVINGYVGEFQGEKQLTSGKFGRMEKISDGITPNEASNEASNEAEVVGKASSNKKEKKLDEFKENLEKMPEEELSEEEQELYGDSKTEEEGY